MYKVEVTNKASKELDKIIESNPGRGRQIEILLYETLPNTPNPFALPNAKKLKSEENKYRWRVGNYRVIGEVYNNILTIEIIKIANRKDAY
ncbi:type II toxin-antitoxin system RelE/ParE family toxin [Helicobacter saguini]|uniref:Type II toxin-antitoxin system RelE/ParE family toxin n=1 Tax=Helicobacter saguini TaxID=1548018 RepID=A0A347VR39_9HELI|nr:type II toxin-antitoxin system RelE/ParE family toxin [Helicobacter saguini]MWV63045.1 type II toxin-antitoxin system RelE/ParE family toxin [Helicobacter saguini]MWV66286.1 type II toxin-antitoxin system RelE/ParE family toxin [Helicobacter saguini]MWV68638.1 type II toxin-antitoxin system RelE/ParE family toxin [Helicobacter saguini]MWV71811.1 type II toxin-antitoxin system RelE/ParE family toxin [Helicobacter saguini]TLD95837.1 type II toxin-antitoxin system RelE/ParE family toxin [Helic